MIQRLGFTAWTFIAACKCPHELWGDVWLGGIDEGWNVDIRTSANEWDRTRPGARVARRRRTKSVVGRSHKVSKDDTIKWFKTRFEGIVR